MSVQYQPSLVKRSAWAWLLDSSIYFSFDSSGFLRHARDFQALPESIEQLHVVVTGANSGIGFACTEALVERGAQVTMICRNLQRGEDALKRITHRLGDRNSLKLLTTDMSDLDGIHMVAKQINTPVHVLIHNAGLLPLEWQLGMSGHELTVAVHLIGPTLLTQLLSPHLKEGGRLLQQQERREGARVIWMASGGMYPKPLDVDYLQALNRCDPMKYDGVSAYAYTKRAQVEWATYLNELQHGHGLIMHHSLHPGWVDTPGVRTSLPNFWRWTKGRLRTLAQGADCALWLALCDQPLPSGFWFDRMARNPYLLGKRPKTESREALFQYLTQELALDSRWVQQ